MSSLVTFLMLVSVMMAQDCGPESMSVVSGDVWRRDKSLSAFFSVENIFTLRKAETSYAGYWLAPDNTAATFIVNLGCQQDFSAIRLVNTHNQGHRDRSTKKFRLSVSMDTSEPWTNVLETSLNDSRQQQDPLPLQTLHLPESVQAQFIKFDLLEWYGKGGGLQYLDIRREGCPAGYESKEGYIPGWGQLKGKIKTTMEGCSEECSKHEGCCSYEYSYSSGLCNLNKDCEPTIGKYDDYHFCTKFGCPVGWSTRGHKCYRLFQDRLSWYEAEIYCQGQGGNLVSVHSKAENEFVARLDSALWSLWLGGTDVTSKNDRWLWSDGSPFSFTNWRKNEPNNYGGMEDCIELNDDYAWNDNKCSKRMKFVCEKAL